MQNYRNLQEKLLFYSLFGAPTAGKVLFSLNILVQFFKIRSKRLQFQTANVQEKHDAKKCKKKQFFTVFIQCELQCISATLFLLTESEIIQSDLCTGLVDSLKTI